MLIGVVSDTHRDKSVFQKVAEVLQDTDLIIHLGDNVQDVEGIKEYYKKKIINVRGNCDFGKKEPLELLEEVEGVKIFITHGHNYDVKYNILKLKYRAEELGADIALFGHTHVSVIEYEEGIWFMNPGSASLPRDAYSSVAIIEINDRKINPGIKLLQKE
ncbi:metallophosphoesterase [Clostridium sp. ZS2-4]|uniref:metallophosphoesterase n=1 Tax=Clostridium sp. ZS2-4 TaxID=2987703 RepID=UPI00227B0C6B|nr:metallophosphoesterase [Clostridium sp. ZS2-4]MCY6355802.1 metallophosphoesterase [Clostridium sp. ZS2-4]